MIAALLASIDAVAATTPPALAAAVAATAVVGAVERWWYGQVEVRTGLLFAAAGGVFATGVGPTCSRDAEGRLRMTTRCFVLLTLVGLVVGLARLQDVPRRESTPLWRRTSVSAAMRILRNL